MKNKTLSYPGMAEFFDTILIHIYKKIRWIYDVKKLKHVIIIHKTSKSAGKGCHGGERTFYVKDFNCGR